MVVEVVLLTIWNFPTFRPMAKERIMKNVISMLIAALAAAFIAFPVSAGESQYDGLSKEEYVAKYHPNNAYCGGLSQRLRQTYGNNIPSGQQEMLAKCAKAKQLYAQQQTLRVQKVSDQKDPGYAARLEEARKIQCALTEDFRKMYHVNSRGCKGL